MIDNPGESRCEVHADGELAAFVVCRINGGLTELVHTETVAGFEGRGFASRAVAAALDEVRQRGGQVLPTCPFVWSYMTRHPDQLDLLPADLRKRAERQADPSVEGG
ncbi:MAG: N-acetyltransferase [Microthrixaceae bacterium]|nr:N-acetyltransferase [Acidimicrobiales bacterium]MCB9403770.1 N-acetyltransferase [Microthrixaceae bacterium]